MGESTRQKKFSRLIQKELGDIFQKDIHGTLGNVFVSIAHVKMSTDLSVAKVYISMLLQKDKDQVLHKINSGKSEIRKQLGNRIGKQVRVVPELIFYIDMVEENANRIESLIDSLDIPPEEDENSSP